jgi:hypothetical protein
MKLRKRQSSGLKPNKQGRYRTYVGHYIAPDGVTKPCAFWLGTDRQQADHRYHQIHVLWRDNGDGVWSEQGLNLARAVAAGTTPKFVPSEPLSQLERSLNPGISMNGLGLDADTIRDAEYSQDFQRTKSRFPSVEIAADEQRLKDSVVANEKIVQARSLQVSKELQRVGALAPGQAIERLTGVTIGKALEGFRKHLEASPKHKGKEGGVSAWGKTMQDQTRSLDFYHSKFLKMDLGQLNKHLCEAMIEGLAQRPKNQRGSYLKPKSAKHLIWLTRTFFEWLDGSDLLWELPAKFRLNKRVSYRALDVDEIKDDVVTIPMEHLKVLIANATELEKTYIGLALNCAYGSDQLGRLQCEWVKDSQMTGVRLKRISASRHYLWECNRPRLAEKIGDRTSGLIFLAPDGRPLYRTSENGNSIDGFGRAWEKLVKRVQQVDANLPSYSFGKLRKTSATLVLLKADPSIASMLLAHKTVSEDELLQAYAVLPWEKLYSVQRELESELVGQLGL